MNILIVGAGATGQKRMSALRHLGENIVGVIDPEPQEYAEWYSSLDAFYAHAGAEKVDWIFVCTPHHETCYYAEHAILGGTNVMVEKPLGRTLSEYSALPIAGSGTRVMVGFNYRFLQGVNQILRDVFNGVFGRIISVNMVLGVGDKALPSWRLCPAQEGRGAILDPGIHLIDLSLLMSGHNLKPITALHWKGFWDTGIEEETHIIAIDGNKAIYNIQASKVRWRPTFRIEVNGEDGYGIVEGRNKHYGHQIYRRGRRWGWVSGRPQRDTEEIVVDYDGEDSFIEETRAILYGTESPIKPATGLDNYFCLEFIDKL